MGVNSKNNTNVPNNNRSQQQQQHKTTLGTPLPGNYEISPDGLTTNSRIRGNSRNQISTNFSNTSNQHNLQNSQNTSSNHSATASSAQFTSIFSQNLPHFTKSENFANQPPTYKIASASHASSYTSNNTSSKTSSSYTSNSSIPNPPPSENFIPNKHFTNLPKKAGPPISSSNNLTKLYKMALRKYHESVRN